MPSAASRLVPLILRLTGRGSDLRDADAARRHIAERAVRPLAFGPPRCLRRDVEVTYPLLPIPEGRAAARRIADTILARR